MTRVMETPGTPTRVETIVTPAKQGKTMIGLSVPVLLARIGYAVLSSVARRAWAAVAWRRER